MQNDIRIHFNNKKWTSSLGEVRECISILQSEANLL